MRKSHIPAAAATLVLPLLALAPAASGQFLMIPDSVADRVGLYDAATGALVDPDFIVDANDPATFNFGTPTEAIQIGDEIFVSDQVADAVFIFDLAGNYLDRIDQNLNHVRGLAAIGDTLYVANAGTANGAPGPAVITYDASTRTRGSVFGRQDSEPFDVEVAPDGTLLVSDVDPAGGGEGVDRFAADGTFLGRVVNADTANTSDGPDFPEQVAVKPDGLGGFYVAGFDRPRGIFDYDADGTFLRRLVPTLAVRGVRELPGGDLIYAGPDGTFVLDPASGAAAMVGPGRRLINPLVIPEPAVASLAAVTGLALVRRRRA